MKALSSGVQRESVKDKKNTNIISVFILTDKKYSFINAKHTILIRIRWKKIILFFFIFFMLPDSK